MSEKMEGILTQESTDVLSSETEREVAAIEMVNNSARPAHGGGQVQMFGWENGKWIGWVEELTNSLC